MRPPRHNEKANHGCSTYITVPWTICCWTWCLILSKRTLLKYTSVVPPAKNHRPTKNKPVKARTNLAGGQGGAVILFLADLEFCSVNSVRLGHRFRRIRGAVG